MDSVKFKKKTILTGHWDIETIENYKFWPPNALNRFTFPSNKMLLKKSEAVLLPQTEMSDTQI